MSKKTIKILIIILIVVITIAILSVVDSYTADQGHVRDVSLNTFRDSIINKSFSDVKIYGNRAEGYVFPHLINDATREGVQSTHLPQHFDNWVNLLLNRGIPVTIKNMDKIDPISFLLNALSGLFSFIIYIFFLRMLIAPSFSRRSFQFVKTNITFADVAGMETTKNEVKEIIDFLKNKDKYAVLNCRTPKGLLISGPPGNGKTLLAKAISGESGVNFIATSASSFIEIYVGTGPKAVRELFDAARKNAPCVIFIDELDSLGRRDNAYGGGAGETTKTINQFLAEMDGIISNAGIVVVGATNHPDMIDPAALRSGRFDRRIVVSNPDYKERLLVLKLYFSNIPLDHSVNIDKIARNTAGFSRADLENFTNEAKIIAIRNGCSFINADHCKDAFDKLIFGLPGDKTDQKKELEKTAFHEAGHAFMFYIHHKIVGKIYKATIIPHGMALGFVMPENNDKKSKTKAWCEAEIQICFAGRIAEEMFLGKENITSGCSGDLDQARREAEHYVVFGMSETYGFSFMSQNQRLWSEKESSLIRDIVSKLMIDMENQTREIMLKNRDRIEKLALRLLEEETLTGEQIIDILENKIFLPERRHMISAVNLGVKTIKHK